MTRDIEKYRNSLYEIKRRIAVVADHLTGSSTTRFLITEVEFLCLQFRKILELIALSSIVANKEEYSKQHDKFAKHYNARLILQDLKRVNPGYYPRPTIQIEKKVDNKTIYELENVRDGFLTEEDFLNIYEICGGMLHAENPYGHKRDIHKLRPEFPNWLNKIMALLNHHLITLVDGETLIIGLMHGAEDGHPHAFEFKTLKGDEETELRKKLNK